MMNLDDKNIRISVMERYLNAETSVSEEISLAEYYASHDVDNDEKAFAKLIVMSHPMNVNMSDEDTAEYDRLVPTTNKVRHLHWHRYVVEFIATAAAIALFFILSPTTDTEDENVTNITTAEIADAMTTIMNLDYNNIESVTAKPNGNTMIIIAKMKDGSSSTFLLAANSNGGTTLFAWNN